MNEQNSVAAQIATLSQMPMADLWQLWDRHFDRRPDKTNRNYLHSQLAYKIQEAAFGAIAPNAMRQLTNIGMRSSKIKGRKKSREIHLAAGTVLVREWGEREHKVTVTADGRFDYECQMFKSLSAVARHIAGCPWSGPLFFGLRGAKESA